MAREAKRLHNYREKDNLQELIRCQLRRLDENRIRDLVVECSHKKRKAHLHQLTNLSSLLSSQSQRRRLEFG